MAEIIEIILVGLYFLAMIGIGVYASKKIQNMEDYVVAGRSLGFWVFTLLMIGSVCSGMSLLGVSGLGFKFAWPTIWEQLAVPLSIAFCIIFFGYKMHMIAKKAGYITVQDYLAHRYESNTTLRGLSALSGIVVSMIYLAGQYTAVSIILMWLFDLPHLWALLLGAAIVTIYTVIGGLYAVSWTTLVQGIMLIAGVVIMAPIVIMAAGGFTHVNEVMAAANPVNVDPWMTAPGSVFIPEYIVSFILLLTIGLACAPHVINNVLAAKDVRYFKWAPLIAFVIYGVVMFLLKFAGFAGMSMVKEGLIVMPDVKNASDYIFVVAIEYAMPNIFIWGILGVIVLAAVMSTTDRLMLTIGTYFSWDIYKKILRPDAPEDRVLMVSRISVFAAAAITLLMAINPPDMLVWLIWAGIGIMFSTFAVPLLAGLYWRGATREGAIASMALGLVSALFFGGLSYFKIKIFAMPMHFSFYAFVLSVLAMIIVSMMTKKTPDKILDETMTGWYIRK
ncbi:MULTISPECIES: sodium:solute symporter [unclassified Methanoregula]|uniref:sodium:solute symporter family protein n=1 Tax=unclassified Methanoregula TaxID=2649730 RepID=UPI0009C56995|nr:MULTISPECIES: sodium:solute symporter family protein [unclassified Methanoregula]OPX65044.1 MAG: sodium/panthothenate symporter [Methanoregula sp. PtaB.Bin085]OPY32352.1 MAG: sodium/panthothenate symporter [Methanoregula sp. PtaU1.Bin006]